MLSSEERIPRVPLPARLQRRVRGDIRDVKTAAQQLHFGLGLMIPITTLPGPWVPRRGLLRRDDDTAPRAPGWIAHGEFFAVRRLERFDDERLLIHHVVVALE